jgi:hypothetical protein
VHPSIRLWLVLSTFLIAPIGRAANHSVPPSDALQAETFARYVTSHDRDGITNSGTAGVFLEAAVPGLYRSAALLAVCTQGEDQRSDFRILQLVGDGAVAEEVIGRYLRLSGRLEVLPILAVPVTPANYKFRFAGQVKTGTAAAYVYDVAPKNNRPGLINGQLWIDSETGREVLLSGFMTDLPGITGRLEFVRNTISLEGSGHTRVTHVNFVVPLMGRAEISITEVSRPVELLPQSSEQY